MEVEISGSGYYERVKITKDNLVIYEGDVIDLLTSQQGLLELKLNYGTCKNCSVILKKSENGDILFVPKINDCFKHGYKYEAIVITNKEFFNLWEKLGYNPHEDIKLINQASLNDYILAWAVTSNYRGDEDSFEEYLSNLNAECLTTSSEQITVGQVFDLLSNVKIKGNIVKNSDIELVSIYLDSVKDDQWDALTITDNGQIFLRLNDGRFNVILL